MYFYYIYIYFYFFLSLKFIHHVISGCVGDLKLTRNKNISLYISGCKPQPHEPVSWGWVRLKVHFISEPFKVYHNECLFGLSCHPLSGRYRTTHNMLSYIRAFTLCVKDVLKNPHRLKIKIFHCIPIP